MTAMRDVQPSPTPGASRWLWFAGGQLQGVGRTREASLKDALNQWRARYDTNPLMGPWELEDAERELRAGQGLEMILQGTTRDIQVVWGHLLAILAPAQAPAWGGAQPGRLSRGMGSIGPNVPVAELLG